ncbi:MAG: hypothetical protein ACI9MC_003803, partial [Kiritimatiellia bacterium]
MQRLDLVEGAKRTMSIEFSGGVTFHERVTLTRASADSSTSRNIGIVFELRGDVDSDALAMATDRLNTRHDALRTGFVVEGGAWTRQVHDHGGSLEVVDKSGGDSVEADARAWLIEFGSKVCALDEPPLWRAALVRVGSERHYFAIVVDHVIGDHYSAAVILTELGLLYGPLRRGEEARLPRAAQQR